MATVGLIAILPHEDNGRLSDKRPMSYDETTRGVPIDGGRLTLDVSEAERRRARDNVRRIVIRNRDDSGLDHMPDAAATRPIRSVGIVGAGMMGAAIAAVHLRQGVPVMMTDANDAALQSITARVVAALIAGPVLDGAIDAAKEASQDDSDAGISETGMPAADARNLVARSLRTTSDEAGVARCDLVLESIVENLEAKRQLFARLEPLLADDALLTTNTSTIPIGQLAAGLHNGSRLCGLHFFHPVGRRPLVEIIRSEQTSDQTIATAVAHAKAIGKMPLVVDDGPGFLVNRLLFPYLSEALDLLLDGVTIEQIERAATTFGMAKGPLRLLDEIGLDTTLQGGIVLWMAFPERVTASPLLVAMVKAKRLGRKSGGGFFAYRDGSVGESAVEKSAEVIDPAVASIIARWAREPQSYDDDAIVARLLLPMLLEATRILEEGKIRDPRDIDLGVLFGLGFPPTHGGLLWWADTLGAKRTLAMLGPLASLGERAQPTRLLEAMAQSGARFYDHA